MGKDRVRGTVLQQHALHSTATYYAYTVFGTRNVQYVLQNHGAYVHSMYQGDGT